MARPDPPTVFDLPTVRTPSLKYPGFKVKTLAGELAPGIDQKGEGGYVVAPPSVHANGRVYEWVKEQPLAELPDWLIERVTVSPQYRSPVMEDANSEIIPEHKRNTTLTSRAGKWRQEGYSLPEIHAGLVELNRRACRPPLPDPELLAIAKSVNRYPQGLVRGCRPPWPEPMASDAFHGLAGDVVRTIAPHSEADPSGLLVQLLAAFGNMIGAGPGYTVESDFHPTRLFVLVVGRTSKGRKGTAWKHIENLAERVDPDWVSKNIKGGLGSGEGLIQAVRDPSGSGKKADPGVTDKRLLVLEQEFASVLQITKRDGNTLSAVMRQAWDRGMLRILTKNSPAAATGAHISIIGHITAEELRRYLTETEMGNGFANRILFLCVRRSQSLPFGGSISQHAINKLVIRLREVLDFSRAHIQLRMDDSARELWVEVYDTLSEGHPGLFGAVTSRAEAQVVRLACLYALLDRSTLIWREHLQAALAVWNYAEASARYIFGDSLGDPLADHVLNELRERQSVGLTRTQISAVLGRHQSAGDIARILNSLAERGLAHFQREETDGRPVERWFATRGGEADSKAPLKSAIEPQEENCRSI